MSLPPLAWLGIALALANVGQYLVWSWSYSDLQRRHDVLDARINDETSGYVRQVAQCQTNVEGSIANLKRLGDSVIALGDATKAGDAALIEAMKDPTKAAVDARNAANALLSRPREAATIGTIEACVAGERALRGEQ